jgi:TolA-binding protein
MIVATVDPNVAVATIVSILGAGGLASGYLGRKVKPEAEAIGNKSLIEVNSELRTEINRQAGLIERLREQNDRQEQVISKQDEALGRAEQRIKALTLELNDLESDRDERGA